MESSDIPSRTFLPCHTTKRRPSIDGLRAAFRTLLAKSKAKITDREKWIGQVVDNPIYQQSREIARFMLFVAADRAMASASEPGSWTKSGVKASDHQNAFLDFKTWRSPLYATLEHVAPDSEQHVDWDAAIYKNSIVRHAIGNLCLLPAKENDAIGNGSWMRKRLFYRALTEPTTAGQQQRLQEAAAQGMIFSEATTKLLNEAQRLPLLDPLRDVDDWNAEVVARRGKNIAGLVWDYLWPWLASS